MLAALMYPCPVPPWPSNPSPRRFELTSFERAHRLAQRINEQFQVPVAILEQACPFQAHRLVIDQAVYSLKLNGEGPVPYKIVATVF